VLHGPAQRPLERLPVSKRGTDVYVEL